MQQKKQHKQIDPMLSFHLMKFAFQDFQKSACNLSHQEYTIAHQHAKEEMLLHQVILTSDDAGCVVVPEATLQHTLLGVIAEYPSDFAFYNALEENHMRLAEYRMALHNDLRVETILSRVAASVQSVTATEIRYHFDQNKTTFNHPEQRIVSHIQIRFTPSSASEVDCAYHKITAIHQRVSKNPERFVEEARLFSDCKTENNDGTIGPLAAGELCPELDRVLFSLREKEISQVIENSRGFNIIRCEEICPPKETSLREASPEIFPVLLKKKQLEACRLWLQELLQPQQEDLP